MKILVLNAGSSSIKFQVFDMNNNSSLAIGLIEEIGNEHSQAKIKVLKTNRLTEKITYIKDHHDAVEIINAMLKKAGVLNSMNEVDGIGHRVVHGGKTFKNSVIIDDEAIRLIKEVIPLAPLHNPGALEGIKSALEEAKGVLNVAVFDTVFHQTMDKEAYLYAIPYEYYEKYDIRKYGFHGTSHKYASELAANFMGVNIDNFNAITLHIGNGASATAIKNGKSIDTSMGLSPLEGLMMGTRSGDIDPTVLSYIATQDGKTLDEIDDILNKKSGLLGIAGTSDVRKIKEGIKNNSERCLLAYKMYIRRIVKYIGAYYALIGKLDAIIFTAGVGENSSLLRNDVCNAISHFGIELDNDLNHLQSNKTRYITKQNSPIKALVVPTNEELAIAIETKELLKRSK
ncbi:acetate kinase [Campylobacter blaseri]|uniref:Acetate kinase n=1 Tax=Campylobacter blaseri TaxID=2042961 RepID=A0A2P8R2M1_9BACT|nr:acetate kinase [Campylobacter blaseri]PSM52756.1 acetate kinase [Campylobacter blaseri]PSM54404.1 acetate kinase [Campylobacter blaseri]QKF86065.1 acetate kinase [Campylobacter blaseri]